MSTSALYEGIADELAEAILTGALAAGSALPTQREFARTRGIGLSTATRVYAALQRRGLVVGEVGRGSFVRERPVEMEALGEAARYAARARVSGSIDGPALRGALRMLASRPDIERLAAQTSPLGTPALRRSLAAHLLTLGLRTDPLQVLATAGGMAALRLAALATLERGQRVAADALTYPGWRLLGEQLGLELLPVAYDQDGPIPESVERLLRRQRVKALHCMPTAHLPLGWVMPMQRRKDIVSLARAHDVVLFEDLSYRHLVLSAPPALAQLAPERTWVVGSLSGTMGDGLRVGYMVAPTPTGPMLERLALAWGIPAAPLIGELTRVWLEDGTVASLQGAQCQQARHLWNAAAACGLLAHSPSTAGWLLWLTLSSDMRADQAVAALRARGIDVVGSEPFALAVARPNALALRMRGLSVPELEAAAPLILAACGFDAGGHTKRRTRRTPPSSPDADRHEP